MVLVVYILVGLAVSGFVDYVWGLKRSDWFLKCWFFPIYGAYLVWAKLVWPMFTWPYRQHNRRLFAEAYYGFELSKKLDERDRVAARNYLVALGKALRDANRAQERAQAWCDPCLVNYDDNVVCARKALQEGVTLVRRLGFEPVADWEDCLREATTPSLSPLVHLTPRRIA